MTIKRCAWCGDDPVYQQYHDEVWGEAVHDDRLLLRCSRWKAHRQVLAG